MTIFSDLKLSAFETPISNVDLGVRKLRKPYKNENWTPQIRSITSLPTLQLHSHIHNENKPALPTTFGLTRTHFYTARRPEFRVTSRIIPPRYDGNHYFTILFQSTHNPKNEARRRRAHFIVTRLFENVNKGVNDRLWALYPVWKMSYGSSYSIKYLSFPLRVLNRFFGSP